MGDQRAEYRTEDRPDADWPNLPRDVGELVPELRTDARPAARERLMHSVASTQANVVHRSQLRVLGFTDSAIARRVVRGQLWQVFDSVYAVGRPDLEPRGMQIAALLTSPPHTCLSHWTAAAVWDLLRHRDPVVHVSTPQRRCRGQSGIGLHRPRRLMREDACMRTGLPVTSVPRTILDLAPHLSDRRIRRLLERSEVLGIYDRHAVDALLGRARGHRGRAALARAQIGMRAHVTRSELERRFLDLCADHGIPLPETNVVIAGHEVDAYWPDRCLVVELDGYEHHADRSSFDSDRDRDLDLASAGIEIVRLSYRMVTGRADATAARLVRLRGRLRARNADISSPTRGVGRAG